MTRIGSLRQTATRRAAKQGNQRRLQLEPLEARRVLASHMVTSLFDAPVTGPNEMPGTLRQAIYDANHNPGPDTIVCWKDLEGTISLTAGELTITDSLIINGPGADKLVIDAGRQSRVLNIDNEVRYDYLEVTLAGLTITGGRVQGSIEDGAGILNHEHLTITDSSIRGNTSGDGGGGIFSFGGSLELINSQVTGNHAMDKGAGLWIGRGAVTITDSVISYNHTFASGGGIFLIHGDGMVTGTEISGNGASRSGGGVFNEYGNLALTVGTTVDNNLADDDGGGVYNNFGDLTIEESTVSGNSADHGGGIVNYSGSSVGNMAIIRSSIDNNVAGHFGGGIQNNFGNLTITDSTISDNHADQWGGGVSNWCGNLTISDSSTISDNHADEGGGIFNEYGTLTVTSSTISGNSAADEGGGIFNNDGTLTVTGSTISGNSAAYGGGIESNTELDGTQTTTITNSTISGNSAAYGGGIYNWDGLTVVEYSTITQNDAYQEGDGVWSFGDNVTRTDVRSSIIAGNIGGQDVFHNGTINSFQSLGYNLIGGGNATGDFIESGDQVIGGADHGLDVLAVNGGPTQTHALLIGSPAIDAGDPNFMPPPDFDQRGDPFARVFGVGIDIGSFESQPFVVDGDFNDDGLYDCTDINTLVAAIAEGTNDLAFDLTADGLVDVADRDAWLAEAGGINLGLGKVYLLGDATLDGVVDGLDFTAWIDHKFTSLAEWCAGDFTADGMVDGLDYIEWNNNKFQSSDVSEIVSPRLSSDPHDITKPNQVYNGTDVDRSSVSPRLAPLVAKRVDSVFAMSRRGEDHEYERPKADSFENFGDDLPTLRPLVVS